MTISIQRFFVLVIAATVMTCSEKPAKDSHFFNVDSLVDAQVVHLTGKAMLSKNVLLNGKQDTIQQKGDSSLWASELDMFKQLNVVNRPANKNLYSRLDEQDTKSNLKILVFKAKDDDKLPVQYLKIYYHNSLDDPRRVEGILQEKSYLYGSKVNLSMDFDNLYNKITLTTYTIKGNQKMFLGDSVHFAIHGKVKLN